jgi:FtsH-binding integral membrane protein
MSMAPAYSPMLFGETDAGASGPLRWLSPALIGLTAPLVAGLVLVPGAIEHVRAAVLSMLAVLMIVCIAAYIISVLSPSVPTSLLVDREARWIELQSQGLLASRSQLIAFEDISDLTVTKLYDDDGYAYEAALMTLTSGEAIALPVTMTSSDVSAARRAIGFATPAHAAARRR